MVDEQGFGLEGVNLRFFLRLRADMREYRVLTAADGRFDVERAADGLYRIEADKHGYASRVQEEGLRVESAPVHGLELTLVPGTRVSGRLLGLEADQLAGVSVKAEQDRRLVGSVSAEGTYEIADLGPGDWLLTVRNRNP